MPLSPAVSPREGAGLGWAERGTSAAALAPPSGAPRLRPDTSAPRGMAGQGRAGQGSPLLRRGPQPLCLQPEGNRGPRSPLPAEPAPRSSTPTPTPPWRREAPPAMPGISWPRCLETAAGAGRGGAGRSGAGRGGCCGRRGARRRQRRQESQYLVA